jgi:Cu(I)/Ag(I) efflux system membrane fusion protein
MSDEPLPEGEEEAPPGVRVMSVVRWILVVAMAAVAVASVLHALGVFNRGGVSSAAAQYYCPMHPSVVQDHPGECPICSMTLVEKTGSAAPKAPLASPKPEGEMAALAPIDLTPERIQLLGMRTAPVTREMLSPELRTVGFVTANEEGRAIVQTRFSGWIEKLMVDKTGQHVTRGQALASVYSPDLLSAQQEFLNALKWNSSGVEPTQAHAVTTGLADDARRRLELLGIAKKEIEELEKTRQPIRALTVRSPVEGNVTQKNVLEGSYVQPGTPLFEVADLSTVWVIADIYEYEVSRLRVGEKARLQLTAYPGETFSGRVQFIYPTLDTDSRTLKVRLQFNNARMRLLPGMYGSIVIELPRAEGLVVPTEAIVDTGDMQYVFLAQAGGRFEPRRVKLGVRVASKVQILEGVHLGETVVTTANFLIDSESRLRATIEGQAIEEEVPIDKNKYPDKYRLWKQCEILHRGMGTMEEDCKNAIPRPWR